MVSTAGAVFIAIFVILIVAAIGWVVFVNLRARRLGLPPPSLSAYNPFSKSEPSYGPPRPAPGGVLGWFNDRLRAFKNRNNRTAAGAYEGGRHESSAPRGGFGPLDPDDAWDARVGGHYYEEQELRDTHTAYDGSGGTYNMNLAATPGLPDEERGRTLSRPGGASGAGGLAVPGGRNPFDDDAEPSNISLRGVSPRPIDTSAAGPSGGKAKGGDNAGDSPTERKSIFRENM